MAIPQGGGGGNDAGFIPLIDFLKDKLGGYFFDREGMPTRDKAYVNLVRLRALFEQTGEEALLYSFDNSQDDKRITVHEAAFDTNSDFVSGAVNALFGQPGRININLGGNSMPHGGDAADAVNFQWSQMEGMGDISSVRSDGPPPPPEPTGEQTLGDYLGIGTPGAGDRDPRPSAPSGTVAGAGDTDPRPAGSPSGGGGDIWSQQDDSLTEEGTARQIPGGEELWRTDDGKVYLAYRNPEAPDLWMIWHVESPERLQAIYGDAGKPYDREMTTAQLKKMSPWYGGLAAELENTSEDPWGQFNSDFKEAAKLRPWLNDPTMQAVMMGAYLEGRAPTQDELSQTDWWNEHTADERAWMEESVTLGREELARRRDDQSMKVAEALRQAGVDNAPKELVRYIAEQSLTGKWSEQYLTQQIRKLSDPFAPGKLDAGVNDLLDGVELDSTAKFESEVRATMEEWLGPQMGRFSDKDVSKWAGRLRNNPDAQSELEDALRQQRLAMFPEYNENLTYRQIVAPVENLATQVWGQPVQDSALLVDLANTMDYTQMAQRLRSEGRKRGVRKVVEDALTGLGQTALGEQVVQSAV